MCVLELVPASAVVKVRLLLPVPKTWLDAKKLVPSKQGFESPAASCFMTARLGNFLARMTNSFGFWSKNPT